MSDQPAFEKSDPGTIETLNARIRALLGALGEIDGDMHNTSTRPCPTCRSVTSVIGSDFGCVRWAKERFAKSELGVGSTSE